MHKSQTEITCLISKDTKYNGYYTVYIGDLIHNSKKTIEILTTGICFAAFEINAYNNFG